MKFSNVGSKPCSLGIEYQITFKCPNGRSLVYRRFERSELAPKDLEVVIMQYTQYAADWWKEHTHEIHPI